MFTGIIQEIGHVAGVVRVGGGVHLSIAAPTSTQELHANDSVAVNGVCQTVVEKKGEIFRVEAVEETLAKTTLGELRESSSVNIELPLKLNDRLGGHMVQGHVDTVGNVRTVVKKASSWLISIGFPVEFRRYLIPVGSIAVDGVSLTVASLREDEFVVSIIPHTLENTTLVQVTPGTRVNLEFDLIGKYIENLVLSGAAKEGALSQLTSGKLREWGYNI